MSSVSLKEPPADPDELLDFPQKPWSPTQPLSRVGLKGLGTWWFSSDGSGRFDLTPPSHLGTCYFGTDEKAAYLEVFRNQPISVADVEARTLRTVHPSSRRALADTTNLGARRFGVTKEIATITPYDICQRWAWTFSEAHFDGLFHHLRHDLREIASGVSLFGPAGAVDADDWELPGATEDEISVANVEAAGILVLPPPASTGLRVV